MRRPTRWGVVHYQAICRECDFAVWTRNALGLAAQHYDRYGHTVDVELGTAITYGEGAPDDQPAGTRPEATEEGPR